MQDLTNRAKGVVPASSLVLILLTISGALLYEKPFQSARPNGPVAIVAEDDGVKLRQWDDPFAILKQINSDRSDGAFSKNGKRATKLDKEQSDANSRLSALQEQIEDQQEETTILLTMVADGQEQATVENRRRERVALGHALVGEGYEAATPGKLKYLRVPELVGDNSCSTETSSYELVPYEWYKEADQLENSNFSKNVLVMWLQDSNLAEPAKTIENILNAVTATADRGSLKVRVIGPSASSVLKKMYPPDSLEIAEVSRPVSKPAEWPQLNPRDDCIKPDGDEGQAEAKPESREIQDAQITESTEWSLNDITVFSHRATVDNTILFAKPEANLKYGTKSKQRDNLQRIIASDSIVTESLFAELNRRSLDLCSPKTSVLLIVQADDIYGTLYEKALKENCPDGESGVIASIKIARYFSYIDGIYSKSNQPRSKLGASEAEFLRKAAAGDIAGLDLSNTRKTEVPTGAHQLDYIRRMAKELRQFNSTVDVIGVIGSDIYDKLLIIQAIRTYLKRPLVFTTDASALYGQPEYYKYNQNLLVVSGFGMKAMDSPEQRQAIRSCDSSSAAAPAVADKGRKPDALERYEPLRFRDSYQTGFYRALLASLCQGFKLQPSAVKVFEVGRAGLIEINRQPSEVKKEGAWADFGFRVGLLMTPLLLLQLFLIGRRSRVPIKSRVRGHFEMRRCLAKLLWFNWFAISALVGLLYFMQINPHQQEPVLVFEGISSTPTMVMRFSAALVAFSLLWYARVLLKGNFEGLRSYFGNAVETNGTPEGNQDAKPRGFKARLKNWPASLRNWIAEIRQIIFSIRIWEDSLHGNLSRSKRAKRGIEWQASPANKIWKEYKELGSLRHRLWRTIPVAGLTIAAMSLIVVGYYGQTHLMRQLMVTVPFFGWSFDLISLLMTVSMFFSIFAILLAGDALKLCTTFVKHHNFDFIAWSDVPYRTLYVNLTPYAKHRIASLEIVMRRTEVMSSIIVFPFLVMFLQVMARSNLFDGWTWDAGVLAVYGGLGLYTLFRSGRLQQAANSARMKVYFDLQRELSKINNGHRDSTFYKKGVNEAEKEREKEREKEKARIAVKEAIDYVAELKRGLFAPVITHPLFQAVAWPSTAVGLIALTQLLL